MPNSIRDWKYYNHAVVSAVAPHLLPDLAPIKNGLIWHIDGKRPLMARYTTEWDCNYETNWWYVIKDSPFDISALKTKRRYEITKSLRFFDVREINPIEHTDALANVQEKAFSAYPIKYRPVFNRELFVKQLEKWQQQINVGLLKVFGAFYKESNELAGYNYIIVNETYLNFAVQKTKPNFEKYNVNAALVNGVLEAFKNKLSKDYYICDGARSINHETHFQDYLEKYFGFRKCYCRLEIVYPTYVKLIICILFYFRFLFGWLGKRIGIFHYLYAVLKMEEIKRMDSK